MRGQKLRSVNKELTTAMSGQTEAFTNGWSDGQMDRRRFHRALRVLNLNTNANMSHLANSLPP